MKTESHLIFYRRYVDGTFATMTNVPAAEDFLSTLAGCHLAIRKFHGGTII